MGRDMESLDRGSCVCLARLIRDNIDVLSRESCSRYRQDYPHSANTRLDDGRSQQWARSVFLSMADQLEGGQADADEYLGLRGDIVLQNEEIAYPIEAFVEESLYEARIVADLVWRSFLDDAAAASRLLEVLEGFTQARICANMDAFAARVSRPRVIADTWQLGRRWVGETAQGSPGEPACMERAATAAAPAPMPNSGDREVHGPLWAGFELPGILTPRERDVAGLVAQGMSNSEVAVRLCLRESTVRNTLTRVYAKLGVASRSELIVLVRRA